MRIFKGMGKLAVVFCFWKKKKGPHADCNGASFDWKLIQTYAGRRKTENQGHTRHSKTNQVQPKWNVGNSDSNADELTAVTQEASQGRVKIVRTIIREGERDKTGCNATWHMRVKHKKINHETITTFNLMTERDQNHFLLPVSTSHSWVRMEVGAPLHCKSLKFILAYQETYASAQTWFQCRAAEM